MILLAALAALTLLAAQPEEPDASAPPPAAPPAAPATTASPAPTPPPPPTIDSLLEQAPISEDAREAAVRAAYAAAQARRGSLDGRWRLGGPDGQTLYIFQLSDPGQSADPRSITPHVPVIEGAWRDPRREGQAGSSGFLADVHRDGAALTIRFYDRDPAALRRVTLRQRSDGAWTGALEGEAGSQPVVMSRY